MYNMYLSTRGNFGLEKITKYGTVNKIVFFNKESNFYIINVIFKNKEKITVLGNGENILKNDYIKFDGVLQTVNYKGKNKEQFKADIIEKIKPQEEETILEYLSSGIIKGISKTAAKEIVTTWGKESLNIIEERPHLLKRIKGLGSKKITQIINSWDSCKPQDSEIKKIIELGFNSYEAISIYKFFKADSYNQILNDPYYVYRKVRNVSFEKIDSIAINNSHAIDDKTRVLTALDFVLVNEHNRTGETIVPLQFLIFKTARFLKVKKEVVELFLKEAILLKNIFIYPINNIEYVQHYTIQEAEMEIAQKLFYLYTNTSEYKHNPISDIHKIERSGEKKIVFSDEQKNAILNCVNNKVSVLTGKPGTGKTTVTNEIVKQLEFLGKKDIILCAPTGKAAQKMSESTGKAAKTIHRLLEYNPSTSKFDKNIKNPLDADVLIIDEASMVDIFLMANLIRAVHNKTQLIIIGDINQLPSIGCGSVLRDIIESNIIVTSYLNEIRRTGKNSEIITTAHAICDFGEFNVVSEKNKESDIYFIESDNDEYTFKCIKYILENRTEKVFGFSNYSDAQILTPTLKGLVGTTNLNLALKEIINTKNDEPDNYMKYRDVIFHKYDRVIQIENNYDKGVYNGDSGIISEIGSDYVYVLFGENEVFYKRSELHEILLSYSMSIHKSQGSEYPLVIMPMPEIDNDFIDRSLVYTGITRGKNTVIIIGKRERIEKACKNEKNKLRKTHLKDKILDIFSYDERFLNKTFAN